MNKKIVPAVYFQKNEDHTHMRRLFHLGGPENGRRKRRSHAFFGYDVAVMYSKAVGRSENPGGGAKNNMVGITLPPWLR